MNSAFVKTHCSLFRSLAFCPLCLCTCRHVPLRYPPPTTASITLISSFPPSFLWLSPLQPSSPGDYYSSVESDLKVELTEKLFALDTDGRDSPIDTEVNTSTFPRLCFSFIDLTFEAVFTESD